MLSDDYWYADAVRLFVGITSIWLAILVIRLARMRHDVAVDNHTQRPAHIGLYAAYSLALVLLCALRLSHLGRAPTWDLWWALFVDLLGVWGAIYTFKPRFPSPARRRRRRAQREATRGR